MFSLFPDASLRVGLKESKMMIGNSEVYRFGDVEMFGRFPTVSLLVGDSFVPAATKPASIVHGDLKILMNM